MRPYLADPDVTIYQADVLAALRELPDESVHMACTSPPFYGLRDYGTGTWEGGNTECDHTPWTPQVSSDPQIRHSTLEGGKKTTTAQAAGNRAYRDACGKCGASRVDQQIGLEPTPDEWVTRLVGVFREVRRVLRSDGSLWVEIGDSYGASNTGGSGAPQGLDPNHTPNAWASHRRSSQQGVAQRHPYKPKDLIGAPWLLAFALRADGWYLRSEIIWAKPNPMPESVTDRPTTSHSRVFLLTKRPTYYFDQEAIREPHSPDGRAITGRTSANGTHENHQLDEGERRERWPGSGRNRRSVWTIATQPYPEAHFATWPEKLVAPMILAGSPEGGTVLDPFGGSGTTAHVARKHGRKTILIELNADYCALAAERLSQQSLLA